MYDLKVANPSYLLLSFILCGVLFMDMHLFYEVRVALMNHMVNSVTFSISLAEEDNG